MAMWQKWQAAPSYNVPTGRPFWQPWKRKTSYPHVRIGHLTLPPPPPELAPPISASTRALMDVALPVAPADDEMARWMAQQQAVISYLDRWQNELRRRYWSLTHVADADSQTCLRCGTGYRHISTEIAKTHDALVWTCICCQAQIIGYARSVALTKGIPIRAIIEDMLLRERATKTDRPRFAKRLTLPPPKGAE